MARTLCLITLTLVATSAFAQPAVPAKPKPAPARPWAEMDRGPTMTATIESAYPARNITQKGIAVRLDEKSQTYVMFDEDLCRYSLGWTGGFVDWKGVVYDGEHRVWPKVVGRPIFGTSLAPGWAKAGKFDEFVDPRTRYKSTEYTKESDEWRNRPYGPVPHDQAQYKGLYLHGQRAVFSYTVAGASVLDSPGLESAGDEPVITRTLNIGKSDTDLVLNVLEHPDAVCSGGGTFVCVGNAALLAHEASTLPPPAGQEAPTPTVAVLTKGFTKQLTWSFADCEPRATHNKRIKLHIPAAATPINLKLLITRVTPTSIPAVKAAAEASAPPDDLSALTHGGPPRYPGKVTSVGVVSAVTDKPYVIDTLTGPAPNPSKTRLRFGGFDFFEGGHSAAITTWDGDVWRVTGIGDKLDKLTWQRIATGLYQPLGLRIVRGADGADQVFVLCRDQLVRLHDLNGDGEADFYECFNGDAQVTEHFHEFAMGLQTDAEGNFYYAKSARHALDAVVPQHGTLLKVSKDGGTTTILANGFRAANGVGIGPNGEFAATDQEGFYTPANRINLILPPPLRTQDSALRTPFYGNLWSYLPTPRTQKDGYDPPLCWLPPAVDRSPAEDLWVTSDRWGPLKGSLIHTSYGTGKLFIVPYEVVGGVPQGGAAPFPDIAFRTGVMRARFNPADGQLYACGLVGWATNMTDPGGFHRVRYTGAPVRMPVALHVHRDALAITFTEPLDKASAADVANYGVQQWNYRWTSAYGSKQYSVADPDKVGADDVEVAAIAVSDDAKTVTLKIPGLAPVMQMKVQLNLKSADGQPVKHTIHNTINRVP